MLQEVASKSVEFPVLQQVASKSVEFPVLQQVASKSVEFPVLLVTSRKSVELLTVLINLKNYYKYTDILLAYIRMSTCTETFEHVKPGYLVAYDGPNLVIACECSECYKVYYVRQLAKYIRYSIWSPLEISGLPHSLCRDCCMQQCYRVLSRKIGLLGRLRNFRMSTDYESSYVAILEAERKVKVYSKMLTSLKDHLEMVSVQY